MGYATSVGFVSAGVLGSFHQLLTRRPPSFIVTLDSWMTMFVSILMCVFAGPFIIMRNAVRGRRIEKRPIGWLVASTAIAGAWSLCSGIVMIAMVLSLISGSA